MSSYKIAPSILSADMGRLADELKAVEEAGADLIHIDIMDGHFVPNLCMGPNIVKACKKYTSLKLDVHLMISNPLDFIDSFADAGADMISFHREATHTPLRVIDKIHERGVKAGIATAPATLIDIYDELMSSADYVLLVSVEPGFGNQKLRRSVLDKISRLKKKFDDAGLDIPIEIDGGVNSQTFSEVVRSGAEIFVVGSDIFEADNYISQVEAYRKIITGNNEE